MKKIILAAFAALSLGAGVANATANNAPAPIQQNSQYSSSEGGWG